MRACVVLTLLLAVVVLAPSVDCMAQDSTAKIPSFSIIQQVLEEQGMDSAVAALQRLLRDSIDAYEFRFRDIRFAAQWLGWENRRGERMTMIRQMITIWPDGPYGWADLGSEYLFLGQKPEAESCWTTSLSFYPENTSVQWQLANIDALYESTRAKLRWRAMLTAGESTGLQGPYLGEEPPGHTPKVFAPGIVSDLPNEFSITFSPDGREIYFSRSGAGVLVCRWTDSGWTAPELVDFFGDNSVYDEPYVSPDNQWIVFNARPTIMDERVICRAPRSGDGWGPAERLFPGMYATIARNGDIYYTAPAVRPDIGVIARRQATDSGYSEPMILDGSPNTERIDAHPYIAPDERLLLFDSDRSGALDMYVCFRNDDGQWSEAVSLNEPLGIPPRAGQCVLSPDGKYLFFSHDDDIYWVSASILDELRPR